MYYDDRSDTRLNKVYFVNECQRLYIEPPIHQRSKAIYMFREQDSDDEIDVIETASRRCRAGKAECGVQRT